MSEWPEDTGIGWKDYARRATNKLIRKWNKFKKKMVPRLEHTIGVISENSPGPAKDLEIILKLLNSEDNK